MLKSKLATACAVSLLALGPSAHAYEFPMNKSAHLIPQVISLPGTGFGVEIGRATVHGGVVDAALLNAIAMWLSANYDMPLAKPPKIAFVTDRTMQTLRYRPFVSDAWSSPANTYSAIAIYVDENQTIYLPTQWTGSTAAELSVLVHEMTHHLQNAAAMRFNCAEDREKIAYRAQQEWLEMFGGDFFAEFESDPFTLLVRTTCPM